jgi:hypothetical protein
MSVETTVRADNLIFLGLIRLVPEIVKVTWLATRFSAQERTPRGMNRAVQLTSPPSES